MRIITSILVILLMMSAVVWAQSTRSSDLPTTDELHTLYQQKQYAELLQKLGRVLQLRPPASTAYDRYEMLMLKGDAQSQLKQSSLAIDAYNLAATAAANPQDAAAAAMDAELIKRAKGFNFTPAHGPNGAAAGPFNLLEPDQHKAAMAALFNERFFDAADKLDEAKKAASLPPVMDGAKLAETLRNDELAATGADAKTGAILKALTDRTQSLIAATLKQMSQRVKAISDSANEKILLQLPPVAPPRPGDPLPPQPDPVYHKRGLDYGAIGELTDIMTTSDKIEPAVNELAPALGADAKGFDDLVSAAKDVRARADDVLHADYTGIYASRD